MLIEARSEILKTERLLLRRPEPRDATAMFERYTSDSEVTRYLCWPRHQSVADTKRYLEDNKHTWQRCPVGTYLIESRDSRSLMGSIGLSWETHYRASVGYALARDSWGRGYATEALREVLSALRGTELHRVYALCHHRNHVSARMLEKCGFALEGTLKCHTIFPNLGQTGPNDVFCYGLCLK